MENRYALISESLSEGHPDKVADQIADAVVDAYLAADPRARVTCEVMITRNTVILSGEAASAAPVPPEKLEMVARGVILDAGYDQPAWGLDPQSFDFQNYLRWLDGAEGTGHSNGNDRDQAVVFGYATDETREKMPFPIQVAHCLMHRHAKARISGALPWLGPSARAQVTVAYEHGLPVRIEKVVMAIECAAEMSRDSLYQAVAETIINPVVPEFWRAKDIEYLVSAGVAAGILCQTQTGMSGRTVTSDTYGGSCPQGSGTLSGQDPGRLERCAAYAARHVAKNLVAAGIARQCTVQLAYAGGRSAPVTMGLTFHGTGRVPEDVAMAAVKRVFDLSPSAIVARLQLRRPIFRHTSVYGHFGRDGEVFTWERTDQAQILRDFMAVALSSKDSPAVFVAF